MALPVLPTPQQQPPSYIPEVPVPPPNFKSVGEQLAAGAAESGTLSKIGKVIWEGWLDILAEALAWLFDQFSVIAEKFATKIAEAENKRPEAFNRLAEAALFDLLGVNARIGGVAASGNRGGRQIVAKSMGDAIIKGLFSTFRPGAGAGVQPGTAAAEQYLTMMTGLALEGWLEGWVMEALSLGQLEKFADLDDKLVSALGLSGVASRVLAPIADITITKPFEWHLNKLYRPTLLSVRQLVQVLHKKTKPPAWVRENLARLGYADEIIDALIAENSRFLSVEDLDQLVSRGIWTLEQAKQHLMDQTYPEEIASALLSITADKRLDSYRRAIVDTAADAFIRRDMGLEQWMNILAKAGLPEREQQMWRILAGIRRELRSKDLSTGDVEQAVKRGILTYDDFRRHLEKQGYSFEDQRTLELLLLSEVRQTAEAAAAREELVAAREEARKAKEEAATARRTEVVKELAVQNVSLAQFERAVRAGIRTLDDYRALLAAQRYAAADQELLVGLLASELDQKRADAARHEELARQAAVKRVNLSDVETAVKRGVLTLDDYNATLLELGYADEDRALLYNLLVTELGQAREAAELKAAAKDQLAARRVSLADLETAVRRGLRSIDDYAYALEQAGFASEDVELLAQLLQEQLDDDTHARESKEAAAARAAARGLSLADLERAVRAGVVSMDSYRQQLAGAGFTLDAVDTLVSLVQLDIDTDAAAVKARAAADELAAIKRISLADLERAVKLGVVPIRAYTDGLKRAGVPADDAEILRLSLLAEMKQVADAQAKRAAAEAKLAARGLSLAQFERSVRAGVRAIAEYRIFLTSEGFPAADVATLVTLLQLALDQDRAAQDLHPVVEAELQQRNLSLSQFERAVLGGVRTLEEYAEFLLGQGYSDLDTNTLLDLLFQQIEAKAAKTPPA
jgi:hypothetical protein